MYMWMVMRTVVFGSLGPEPVRRVPEPVRRMPEPVRRMPDDDLVESFSSDVFSVISGDSNPLSCENFAATKKHNDLNFIRNNFVSFDWSSNKSH